MYLSTLWNGKLCTNWWSVCNDVYKEFVVILENIIVKPSPQKETLDIKNKNTSKTQTRENH